MWRSSNPPYYRTKHYMPMDRQRFESKSNVRSLIESLLRRDPDPRSVADLVAYLEAGRMMSRHSESRHGCPNLHIPYYHNRQSIAAKTSRSDASSRVIQVMTFGPSFYYLNDSPKVGI